MLGIFENRESGPCFYYPIGSQSGHVADIEQQTKGSRVKQTNRLQVVGVGVDNTH